MTAQRFVEEVERYYGPYERRTTRKYVLDYISKTYSDRFRNRLFKRLLSDFSGQFKITPDIAILEELKAKILQEPDYHAPALPAPRDKPTDAEREEMARQARELIDNLAEKKRMRESVYLERSDGK